MTTQLENQASRIASSVNNTDSTLAEDAGGRLNIKMSSYQ